MVMGFVFVFFTAGDFIFFWSFYFVIGERATGVLTHGLNMYKHKHGSFFSPPPHCTIISIVYIKCLRLVRRLSRLVIGFSAGGEI